MLSRFLRPGALLFCLASFSLTAPGAVVYSFTGNTGPMGTPVNQDQNFVLELPTFLQITSRDGFIGFRCGQLLASTNCVDAADSPGIQFSNRAISVVFFNGLGYAFLRPDGSNISFDQYGTYYSLYYTDRSAGNNFGSLAIEASPSDLVPAVPEPRLMWLTALALLAIAAIKWRRTLLFTLR